MNFALLLLVLFGCGILILLFVFRKRLFNKDESDEYEEYNVETDEEYCDDGNDENGDESPFLHMMHTKIIMILSAAWGLKFVALGFFMLVLIVVGSLFFENMPVFFKHDHELQNPNKKSEEIMAEKKEKKIGPKIRRQIPAQTEPSLPSKDGKLTGAEIFEKYNSAVFIVYASNGMSGGKQGSGFFVNDSGLAVSNHHVFSGTTHWVVKLANGQTFNVSKIISQSEKDDYMVFKVNLAFRCNYIPVTNKKSRVGESVFAIGSPLGYQNTLSPGIISQLRGDSIQFTAPIDHGSSGGALINEYGEVIGITTSKVEGTSANLNFAKDISILKDKLDLDY